MDQTPRSLLKGVQRDLNNPTIDLEPRGNETKNMIKGFISVNSVPINESHSEVLKHSAFEGCQPRISDQVFSLENYASESALKVSSAVSGVTNKNSSVVPVNYEVKRLNSETIHGGLFDFKSYTSLECTLLCLNILISSTIFFTALCFGVVILSINS